MPAFFQAVGQEIADASNVDHHTVKLAIPKDWHEQAGLHLVRTDIYFLDDLLGGGQAPGEVYGIMGPFGSCNVRWR